MKKLSLNLDQLTVDSFDTAPVTARKGAVFGEQCTCPTNCQTNCTCPGCPTCVQTECNQATCDTCDQWTCVSCYPCGTDYGYTCDYSVTAGGWNCQCCPL